MSTTRIEEERIRWHRSDDGDHGDRADIVVYWMQQSARARENPALEYAVQQANRLGVPLLTVFCVVADYPDASVRHYRFLLEGLGEVSDALARRNIQFSAVVGAPDAVFGRLAERIRLLVVDRGYLAIQRRWRHEVCEVLDSPVVEVEGDAVVPVDLASETAETAARTIRPRIHAELDRFVVDLTTTALDHHLGPADDPTRPLDRLDLDDLDAAIGRLDLCSEPGAVSGWPGGYRAARRRLDDFLDGVLGDYRQLRTRYDLAASSSMLSPHLHFGQISPVEITRRARAADAPSEEIEAFVEELVVRRELAINFVVNNPDHDRFAGLPDWARATLDEHRHDEREVVLTASELEAGRSPDELWNTIMAEIRERGWVHNQLRMYWGKQIVRWTNTPGHAFRTLLDLNNRYFLDGRDPNSYANVAWCFGQHDQGFQEREVIGKTRPFTDQALRRKGDLEAWLDDHRPV